MKGPRSPSQYWVAGMKLSELLVVLTYLMDVTHSHANGTRMSLPDLVHESRIRMSCPVWWGIGWQPKLHLPSSNSVERFHASAVRYECISQIMSSPRAMANWTESTHYSGGFYHCVIFQQVDYVDLKSIAYVSFYNLARKGPASQHCPRRGFVQLAHHSQVQMISRPRTTDWIHLDLLLCLIWPYSTMPHIFLSRP